MSRRITGRTVLEGVLLTLCIAYTLAMLYLLFFERVFNHPSMFYNRDPSVPYLKTIWQHLHLRPLVTIRQFAKQLIGHTVSYRKLFFDFAFGNLFGNVLFFIPIGLFVPHYFPDCRRPFYFFATVLALDFTIELTQLLTLTGSFDIDDVILNTAGALLGYACYSAAAFFMHHRREDSDGRNT
ncbi:MAG: VanZ family protein [Oscillospiraceae bacterium]|nr:VanZ family protein [Oscillospiraceae bacterium]